MTRRRYELVLLMDGTGGINYYTTLIQLEPSIKPKDYWTLEKTNERLPKAVKN